MPKTCQFVLPAADEIPFDQALIRCARPAMNLHAMVVHVGQEVRRPNEVYDCSGELHGLPRWALMQLTLEGRGHLDYEGRVYTLKPGQALLLTLPHAYRYWRDGNDSWRFLHIGLTGYETVRVWQHVIERYGPSLTMSSTDALTAVVADTVRDGFAQKLNNPAICSAKAYELSMALLAHQSRLEPEQVRSTHRPYAITAAVDFAQSHYAEPIGVGEMADAAGLSRFHFSRLFQEHIGIAPGEFLRQERLRAVIRLLQSTELPLKTIAQQTGLPNAEYLSRMFRKVQGVSPRSFREANRR